MAIPGEDYLAVVSPVLTPVTVERLTPVLGFVAALEKDTPDAGKAGEVRWAKVAEEDGLHPNFRSIVNFQFEPIPLQPGEEELAISSSFAISGEHPASDSALLLRLKEDGTIMWQKGYGSPFNARQERVIWPSYSQVVSSGTRLKMNRREPCSTR